MNTETGTPNKPTPRGNAHVDREASSGQTARSRLPRLLLAGAAAGAAYATWRGIRGRGSDLDGKVVLITGGSRGLGLVMARAFAEKGCRIVICARDAEELQRARQDLESRDAEVLDIVCDVTDRDQVDRMVKAATRRFGGVDILVNNASIIQVGPLENLTYQDFVDGVDVNFWGTVHPTLALLSQLKERRGRIVNIDSIGGRVAVPHLLPYTCGKFATYGFSEGLRAEVKKDGIHVTTVVPGMMRTGSPVHAFFKGQQAKEFTWFSLGGATSLSSISAERAARRIVRGAARGDALVTITLHARLLRGFHDLFPGTTTNLFALVNRMLPKAGENGDLVRGMELSTAVSPSRITGQMNRAGRRNNEYGGSARPSARHAKKAGLEREGQRRGRGAVTDPRDPPDRTAARGTGS